MYKPTSFTNYTTAEGERLSYTYSKIADNGDIVDSNIRKTIVIPESEKAVLKACETIKEYVKSILPAE